MDTCPVPDQNPKYSPPNTVMQMVRAFYSFPQSSPVANLNPSKPTDKSTHLLPPKKTPPPAQPAVVKAAKISKTLTTKVSAFVKTRAV